MAQVSVEHRGDAQRLAPRRIHQRAHRGVLELVHELARRSVCHDGALAHYDDAIGE
jgi:hypothetical protein